MDRNGHLCPGPRTNRWTAVSDEAFGPDIAALVRSDRLRPERDPVIVGHRRVALDDLAENFLRLRFAISAFLSNAADPGANAETYFPVYRSLLRIAVFENVVFYVDLVAIEPSLILHALVDRVQSDRALKLSIATDALSRGNGLIDQSPEKPDALRCRLIDVAAGDEAVDGRTLNDFGWLQALLKAA
jgi:hypothetical protein